MRVNGHSRRFLLFLVLAKVFGSTLGSCKIVHSFPHVPKDCNSSRSCRSSLGGLFLGYFCRSRICPCSRRPIPSIPYGLPPLDRLQSFVTLLRGRFLVSEKSPDSDQPRSLCLLRTDVGVHRDWYIHGFPGRHSNRLS